MVTQIKLWQNSSWVEAQLVRKKRVGENGYQSNGSKNQMVAKIKL